MKTLTTFILALSMIGIMNQIQAQIVPEAQILGILIDITGAGITVGDELPSGVVVKIINGSSASFVFIEGYEGKIGTRVGLTSSAFQITKNTWRKKAIPSYNGAVLNYDARSNPAAWRNAMKNIHQDRIKQGGKPCTKGC